MWPNLYRIITFDYIPVFCKIFFGNVVTEHAWSQVLLWSLSQRYSAGIRDSMPSLSQQVSPGNGISQRVLEFFPVPQFTLCKGKTCFHTMQLLIGSRYFELSSGICWALKFDTAFFFFSNTLMICPITIPQLYYYHMAQTDFCYSKQHEVILCILHFG